MNYQMVENMPFHSPSHQLYLGLPHFSYCSSYSMLQCFKYPCCPSVTSNHVMSIEPGKEHRARLYMLIVLAVKINQRSAHIVHKARLVETQKLSSKSQQKHMNSQYKCHQRPPIVICGPTLYAHMLTNFHSVALFYPWPISRWTTWAANGSIVIKSGDPQVPQSPEASLGFPLRIESPFSLISEHSWGAYVGMQV